MAGDNGASGGRTDNIINLADFKTTRPEEAARDDDARAVAGARALGHELQQRQGPLGLAIRAHRALCDWKVAAPAATAPKAPRPSVASRFVGTLAFQNGYPTDETVRRLYDELDFQRATQAMLRTMPALNMHALRIALGRDFGVDAANKLAIFTPTSSTLMLAADPDAVYGLTYLALEADGATIVELPPGVTGFVNDMWMRPVVEFGAAGGMHLLAPPNHHATALAAPCPATQLQTYGACIFLRSPLDRGGDDRIGRALLKLVRIYPRAKATSAPAMSYVDASGKSLDATPPNDIRYFEMLARLVTREHDQAFDAETAGVMKAIGIEKGKPFAPDTRLKNILIEAAMVASYMAQTLNVAPRQAQPLYRESQWLTATSTSFSDGRFTLLDRLIGASWVNVGTSPGRTQMTQSAWTHRDGVGEWLLGERSYHLRIPPDVPVKGSWSVTVYDNWTRAILANGSCASKNSRDEALCVNADGSTDLYFGPQPAAGRAGNWIRTLPRRGWFAILRLHEPTEIWSAKTWAPDDIFRLSV